METIQNTWRESYVSDTEVSSDERLMTPEQKHSTQLQYSLPTASPTSLKALEWSKPELALPAISKPKVSSDSAEKFEQLSLTSEVDIFSIMETLHKLGQSQRKSARAMRYFEYQQKWQSLERAAKELKESAVKEFSASMIQGAIQVAGGAYSVHVTVKSTIGTKKLIDGIKPENATTYSDYQFNQAKFQADLQVQQNRGNIGQTFTQLGQGVGSILGAPLTYASKIDQEEQKQAEAEAEKHSAIIDEVRDYMDQIKQILETVRSKYSAIEQSQYDTRQKIFS